MTPARRSSPGRIGNKSSPPRRPPARAPSRARRPSPPAPRREPPFRIIPKAEQLAAGRALDRVAAAAQVAFAEACAANPGLYRRIPKAESRAAGRALDRVAAAGQKAWLEFQTRHPELVKGARRRATLVAKAKAAAKAPPVPVERRR